MPKIGENIGTEKWNLAVGLRHNIDKGIDKCNGRGSNGSSASTFAESHKFPIA